MMTSPTKRLHDEEDEEKRIVRPRASYISINPRDLLPEIIALTQSSLFSPHILPLIQQYLPSLAQRLHEKSSALLPGASTAITDHLHRTINHLSGIVELENAASQEFKNQQRLLHMYSRDLTRLNATYQPTKQELHGQANWTYDDESKCLCVRIDSLDIPAFWMEVIFTPAQTHQLEIREDVQYPIKVHGRIGTSVLCTNYVRAQISVNNSILFIQDTQHRGLYVETAIPMMNDYSKLPESGSWQHYIEQVLTLEEPLPTQSISVTVSGSSSSSSEA